MRSTSHTALRNIGVSGIKKDTIDSLCGDRPQSPTNNNTSAATKSKTMTSINEAEQQSMGGGTTSSSNNTSTSAAQAAASAATANNYQNQPFKCLANSIEPRFLLTIIVERLESHKKVDVNASTAMNSGPQPQQQQTPAGNQSSSSNAQSKVKCVPSARTINCPHHCVAILATRLFAILCNEPAFQQKLVSNENSDACFNMIIEILYPNNDPVYNFFLDSLLNSLKLTL